MRISSKNSVLQFRRIFLRIVLEHFSAPSNIMGGGKSRITYPAKVSPILIAVHYVSKQDK